MADINLQTKKRVGFFTEEKLLITAKIAAVILAVTVVSLSILFFFLSKDPTVAQQNADKSQTLAQLTLLHDKTAKYLIIVDRTAKIQALEQKKVHLDQTIAVLVKQIPSGATITDFSLDQHTFSLSVATANLSLLGTTVDNFSNLVGQKKAIQDVTIQGIISDEKGQTYVLTITGDIL